MTKAKKSRTTKPSTAKPQKRKPPTHEQAVNLLVAAQKARVQIEAECRELQRNFIIERDSRVAQLLRDMAEAGQKVGERLDVLAKVTAGEDRLKQMLGESDKIIFDGRKVEDPFMSHAEVVEQRRKWPTAHDIGRIAAKVNMVTLIGGFARFDKKTEAEIAAAMRFLSLSQRAAIATDRAIDYAAPMVDTSWSGDSEKAMISGDDARRELAAVRKAISPPLYDLVRAVVVHDVSVRSIGGDGASGNRVMAISQNVRRALGLCAEHWHLTGVGNVSARLTGWDDGAPALYTGEVVNPARTKTSSAAAR